MTVLAMAQTQIENGGFENWDNLGNDTEEPQQWSSLKTSTDDNNWLNLANQAPQVLWRETSNPHSGSACMKLVVANYNALAGVAPNGIVTNGRVFASTNASEGYVFTDVNDSQWHTSCSDKPDSLAGWYRYAPQNGDQATVEILFHISGSLGQLPSNGSTAHWIGQASTSFTSTQSSWKRFSVPISWLSGANPNYMLIICSAGNGTNSEAGSTLWIDDLELIYNPEPTGISELSQTVKMNYFNNQISFTLPEQFTQADFKLYNLMGQMVLQNQIETTALDVSLNNGIYIYQISVDGLAFTGKISVTN